jgi:prepilin-type N-terminal cleavage/methylation domain-containing protein
MKSRHRHRGRIAGSAQAGFTVIEMLVVLVLVGLVASIVMGTLGAVVDARTRAASAIERATDSQLAEAWTRQPLNGLLPDYDDRPHVFRGDRRKLAGLTARALLSPTAGPVPFTLALEYDGTADRTALVYSETIGQETRALTVDSWPGERGGFLYRGERGAWVATWPLPRAPGGLPPPQLPRLVRLDRAVDEGIASLVVAPKQNAERNKRVVDLERELRSAPIEQVQPEIPSPMEGASDAMQTP